MSQALIMNVVGAILLFVAILVHIVCMATPHMAGVDFPSIKDDVQNFISNSRQFGSRSQMRYVISTINRFLSIEISYGPWKKCTDSAFLPEETCDEWEDPEDWIQATQAFSVLGVLAGIVALAVSAISILFLCKGNWKKILPLLVCILACGAGALIIIEAIIFAAKYSTQMEASGNFGDQFPELIEIMEDAAYLGWGFGLDIVAAILLFIAGIVHVLGTRAAQREGTV